MKVYLHGEVCLKEIDSLPKGLKRVKSKNDYIIAPSENSGNHHCIENSKDVEIYEKDGVLFMKNNAPAKMFCVDEARHDTEIVPAGIWEVNRANEYDYLSEMVRKVQD